MNIKRLVVFGDSILDAGNLIKTLNIPQEPYYKGRFSNGIVSTEYLADRISAHQNDGEVKHLNYAIGGAFTHGRNPSSLLKNHSFSVSDQLVRFENDEGRFSKDDLVIINGGANNFMFMIYSEIPYINLTAKFRVARDLRMITRKAIKMGAKNIIVWNVPDVTNAPAYNNYLSGTVGKAFKSYIQLVINFQNGLLRKNIANLQLFLPDVTLNLFDFNTVLSNCVRYPSKFGFENVTDVCVDSYGGADSDGNIQYDIEVISDPNKYLCWDYCHPTTRGHEVISDSMYDLWESNYEL